MSNEPKLTDDDRAKLAAFTDRLKRFEVADADSTFNGPPRVMTAREIYKRTFGVEMPDNVTANPGPGSTVVFETRVPFAFYFGRVE